MIILMIYTKFNIKLNLNKGPAADEADAEKKRNELIKWEQSLDKGKISDTSRHALETAFNGMSDDEIETTHDFVFNYLLQKKKPSDTAFLNKMQQIQSKYKIFT